MSKISVIVPTHNNQDTVLSFAKELIDACETKISGHDYEIIFVDNNSSDQTKSYLARLCKITQKVKCVYTVADYGFELAAKYGMNVLDAGVAVLSMHAPWEIIAKEDLIQAYAGYKAFLKI